MKRKLLFFAIYMLAAPLCGYYWNNHVWEERIQRERGRIIEAQLEMAAKHGGNVYIPGGRYIVGEGTIKPREEWTP